MRRPPNPTVKIPRTAALGLAGVLAAALLGAGGCLMRPTYSVNFTTADGVQMEVPLSVAKVDVGDDQVSVKNFQFTPWRIDKGKGLAFTFQLVFAKGYKPVSIVVDDVSDTPILSVYTDDKPVLLKDGVWSGLSPAHSPADEYVKWVSTLDNTVKVYRFTVKLTDGTTHVLRFPIFVPSVMKAFIRSQLGI
jgi:hypothetical protein